MLCDNSWMDIDGCCSAKRCIGTKMEPKNKSSVTFFYFTLSGTKTHIKTCKTWINWRKPAADTPSCVPMYSHPLLQQHHKQGPLKKNKNNFVQIPAVLFTNLTSSEGWKTAGPKPTKLSPHAHPSQPSPKNSWEEGCSLCPLLHTQPTFVHSAACILKLVFLICACGQALPLLMQVGKTALSGICLSKSDWVTCSMHIKHFIWYFGR